MPTTDDVFWRTDHEVFLSLTGGKELIDWFGFVPSFHDGTIKQITVTSTSAILEIKTFRMTEEVDARGYFVLDRHCLVRVEITGLRGAVLEGQAGTIISDLGIRRLVERPTGWAAGEGPDVGDLEAGWDSCWGMDGVFYGRDVRFMLEPLDQAKLATGSGQI